MTSQQKVEVAIRVGLIAKKVLCIADTGSAVISRMQLMELVSDIKTLDEKLSAFANEGAKRTK